MTRLIVRNVPQDVKDRLEAIAARHGVSMEAEVRSILERASQASEPEAVGLGTTISARFAQIGLEQPIAEMRHGPARSATFADGQKGNEGA